MSQTNILADLSVFLSPDRKFLLRWDGEGRERVLEMSGQIQTWRRSHAIVRLSLSDGGNLKIPAGSKCAGFTCSEEKKALVKEMKKVLTALTPSHTSAPRRLLFQPVTAALMKLNWGGWSSSCRQQRGRRPGRGQTRLRRESLACTCASTHRCAQFHGCVGGGTIRGENSSSSCTVSGSVCTFLAPAAPRRSSGYLWMWDCGTSQTRSVSARNLFTAAAMK